jgi:hypothetical protein
VDPREGLDDLEKRKFLALPGLDTYTDYAIPTLDRRMDNIL